MRCSRAPTRHSATTTAAAADRDVGSSGAREVESSRVRVGHVQLLQAHQWGRHRHRHPTRHGGSRKAQHRPALHRPANIAGPQHQQRRKRHPRRRGPQVARPHAHAGDHQRRRQGHTPRTLTVTVQREQQHGQRPQRQVLQRPHSVVDAMRVLGSVEQGHQRIRNHRRREHDRDAQTPQSSQREVHRHAPDRTSDRRDVPDRAVRLMTSGAAGLRGTEWFGATDRRPIRVRKTVGRGSAVSRTTLRKEPTC